MCELFALSSHDPASVGFTLERLARRGGLEGPHRDGWGVAFYQGKDVLLLREPRPAAGSDLVQFIEIHAPPVSLLLSHLRRATIGGVSLANTQPFMRELGGYCHVFAHNGDLPAFKNRCSDAGDCCNPVGETDSELAFCRLLKAMRKLWARAERKPGTEERCEVVAQFADSLRPLGPANFIYSDGELLYAHADRRRHDDGQIRPPGLYLLEWARSESRAELANSGVELGRVDCDMIMLASVPLTDGDWQPLQCGEIAVIDKGRLVYRRQLDPSKTLIQ